MSTFRGWETYYRDLIALLECLDEPVWLAGHSIGATTSIMAAARRPDKVLGLVLAEPVIMDPMQGLKLWLTKLLRQSQRLSLAAGAARRRRVFQSHAAALENYRGRGGFKTWPEAWLNAYVQHAFVPQGDQVQLACAPEWESTTFAHTEHNPWPGIRQLRCPVIALAAERGSTFSPKAQKRLKALLPSADIRILEGTTHFLPMEQKDTVRDAILQLALTGCREN
ncbi:MAG: alpha/beta hydrolase [Marinobacter sp. 34-60-7]|nr:MAG: alpha/beta hydrolase [Marinobacter sp. 34-60-7]